jgi:subtilase family serine protease
MLNLAVSTPSGYSCFISAPQIVDCATTATTTIEPGATVEINLLGLAPREPGPLAITATADPLDAIPEGDETDNGASDSVTVRPPDFSIAVNGTPDPVDAVHSVTFQTTITNDGPASARVTSGTRLARWAVPDGMLNLAVSTPTGYSCFISAPQVVDCATTATVTIPAGGTVEINLLGLASRQPGTMSVTATADPLGAIPEGDESDNSVTESVTVQPPDFSITTTATPDPVDALSSVTWHTTITNDGPAAARVLTNTVLGRFEVPAGLLNLAVSTPSGFTCFIAAPQVVDCQTTATRTMAVGDTVEIDLIGTAPRQPGEIEVTTIADPLDAIPEADETDNSATAATTVQPPDFSTALVGGPDPVAQGGATTWTATITNDGPARARLSASTILVRFQVPAGLTNLAVSTPSGYTCFISAPQTIDCQTGATTTILAGDSVVVTLLGKAPNTAGSLSVTAIADPASAIPEGDETNNAATATINVN